MMAATRAHALRSRHAARLPEDWIICPRARRQHGDEDERNDCADHGDGDQRLPQRKWLWTQTNLLPRAEAHLTYRNLENCHALFNGCPEAGGA